MASVRTFKALERVPTLASLPAASSLLSLGGFLQLHDFWSASSESSLETESHILILMLRLRQVGLCKTPVFGEGDKSRARQNAVPPTHRITLEGLTGPESPSQQTEQKEVPAEGTAVWDGPVGPRLHVPERHGCTGGGPARCAGLARFSTIGSVHPRSGDMGGVPIHCRPSRGGRSCRHREGCAQESHKHPGRPSTGGVEAETPAIPHRKPRRTDLAMATAGPRLAPDTRAGTRQRRVDGTSEPDELHFLFSQRCSPCDPTCGGCREQGP